MVRDFTSYHFLASVESPRIFLRGNETFEPLKDRQVSLQIDLPLVEVDQNLEVEDLDSEYRVSEIHGI